MRSQPHASRSQPSTRVSQDSAATTTAISTSLAAHVIPDAAAGGVNKAPPNRSLTSQRGGVRDCKGSQVFISRAVQSPPAHETRSGRACATQDIFSRHSSRRTVEGEIAPTLSTITVVMGFREEVPQLAASDLRTTGQRLVPFFCRRCV